MWLTDSGCSDTVVRAWQVDHQGTPMFKVTKKLKKCKKMLKSWSKEHFGSIKSQIARKKELLWKAEELAAKGGDYELDSSLAVVKDLFIAGTKMWNSGLIDQIFFPWEAESIKNMPVSFRTDKDLLTWPWTADGGYSVKSAYQILANEALSTQAGSSNPEASKILWSGIWKLKVPNKVKQFMWRASNESLPTKFNLCARHVLPDNRCSLCEECPKDVIHCLWLCDHAKCIWFSDHAFHHPRTRTFRCFGDLMTFVLTELSSSTTALFSMVAWCIWTRRNRLRGRQSVWDVGVTVKRARELLQEFNDVQVTPTRLSIPKEKAKWKPPGPTIALNGFRFLHWAYQYGSIALLQLCSR
nr:putative ribonuclease h protein [Quercus suber]